MKPFRTCGFALAVLLGVASQASAQTPGRNITIVVPFTPGGNTNDILARLFADEFKQRLGGQTVIVENKPGASGNIGAQAVATAAADGHTLLVSGSPLTQNVGLFKSLPYDPVKSFAPISVCRGVDRAGDQSIGAGQDHAGVRGLPQGAPRPAQLFFSGTRHAASPDHGAVQAGRQQPAACPCARIGTGGADLVGGHVSAMFLPISVAKPLVDGGQIRMLAVASAKRLKFAPDVPTLTEQGVKGVEVPLWYGLWAPAGTAPEVVARYNAMATGHAHAGHPRQVRKQGIDPVGGTAEEFRVFVADDLVKWTKILKDAGIVAE